MAPGKRVPLSHKIMQSSACFKSPHREKTQGHRFGETGLWSHHGTQVMLSPSATHCIALHSYAAGIALFQSQIASRRDVYVLSTQTTPSSSPPFQTGIKFARYPWTAQASGVVKIPSVSVRPL